jgi:hypothetical protein
MTEKLKSNAVGNASGRGGASGSGATVYQEQPRKPDHPLAYASARVERASDHLTTLAQRVTLRGQQQIDGMKLSPSQTDPDQIVLDPRADLGLDPVLGILVGEACYNLRGALDYLVYELALHNSGAIQRQTQFPIEDTAARFTDAVRRGRLIALNDAQVQYIETLQPYNGCKWTLNLRELSNPDKHRFLIPTSGKHDVNVRVLPKDHPDVINSVLPKRFAQTLNGQELYVLFDINTALQFEDGSPAMATLEDIKTNAAHTLDHFRSDFA